MRQVVQYGVENPKTERLQDGAAQSAFEKRTESGRHGRPHWHGRPGVLERSARSARYGPHEFAMSERGWEPLPLSDGGKCVLLGGRRGGLKRRACLIGGAPSRRN